MASLPRDWPLFHLALRSLIPQVFRGTEEHVRTAFSDDIRATAAAGAGMRSLVLNIDMTSFVAALEEQLSRLPRFNHLQSIAIPHDIRFERFVARQDAVVAVRPLPALGLHQLGRLFGRYLIPVTNKPLQYVFSDLTAVCRALISVDRLDKPLSEMSGVFSRAMATTCETHIDSPLQGQPAKTLLWINTDICRCFVHLNAVGLCSLVVQNEPPTPHILTAKVIRLRNCICSTCLSGEACVYLSAQHNSRLKSTFTSAAGI